MYLTEDDNKNRITVFPLFINKSINKIYKIQII